MLVTVNDRTVTELPALRFADAARRLGAAAHEAGLSVPAFRSPPRVPDAARTIRRYPAGAVVSVRLRGRPFAEVVGDMVDGVLAANRVPPADAPRVRSRLVAGLGAVEPPPAPPSEAPSEGAAAAVPEAQAA
jgi:hypothetical protein